MRVLAVEEKSEFRASPLSWPHYFGNGTHTPEMFLNSSERELIQALIEIPDELGNRARMMAAVPVSRAHKDLVDYPLFTGEKGSWKEGDPGIFRWRVELFYSDGGPCRSLMRPLIIDLEKLRVRIQAKGSIATAVSDQFIAWTIEGRDDAASGVVAKLNELDDLRRRHTMLSTFLRNLR